MNGNCATGCKHSNDCKRKEYKEWNNRNKNNTYSIYKDDFLSCFEPTEYIKALNESAILSEKILNNMK